MTVAIASRRGNGTFECCGAQVRAYSRHLATVVTVRGEIDAVNVDPISEYVRHFVVAQYPVVLDLSGVTYFSTAGFSLLCALDEECYAAGVQWTLVTGAAVSEVLGEGRDDEAAFPTARSVHAALGGLADAITSRRELVLPLLKKTA
ncbi:STAS domain-containing protein [Mycobacterium bourgelatii]|uniref:Sulfate transporter n=1 Tax=Mycobacterium bourgelatii TaxID=1273442 RepID=A0A7I9YI60_MYCBU|nr:STAS domain-containing protein [Mycobacterium bourgelatii]MCV6977539.1 STAS domain-containing protein [Mycobacterium bourgelatii]GFG88361.1 sulfate transporter [Mycobacterium bourgelatii]